MLAGTQRWKHNHKSDIDISMAVYLCQPLAWSEASDAERTVFIRYVRGVATSRTTDQEIGLSFLRFSGRKPDTRVVAV